MINAFDECYKLGLDYKENHKISKLYAIRNSFIAFMLEIELNEDALLCFSSVHEALINKKLQTYRLVVENGDLNFNIYEVACVNGFADPLIKLRYKELYSGERLLLYVCSELGDKKIADEFINIRLFKDMEDGERLYEQKSLKIEQLDFALPNPKDYVNKVDFWQHNSCLARYYRIIEYSDEHFELLEKYVEALAKLGQRSITIIASNTPWDGQRRGHKDFSHFNELFETQMSLVYKDGSFLKFDFSVIDRYIKLCEKHGISDEIEVFGLCGAWTEKSLVRAWTKNGFVYLSEGEFECYIKAIYEHFTKMGYIDKTVICADEPCDRERFSREIGKIRSLAPEFRFKGAFDNLKFFDEFGDSLKHVVLSFETAKLRYRELSKLNVIKTWYVCCNPNKPNSFLSSGLLEIRALAYINRLFGMQGVLRWAAWAFTKNPYSSAKFASWPLGDSYFIYPGADGKPVLSLRYFMFRRMMEDIQLLSMLGKDSSLFVENILKIKSPDEIIINENKVKNDIYSLKYSDYEAARLGMIQKIKGL